MSLWELPPLRPSPITAAEPLGVWAAPHNSQPPPMPGQAPSSFMLRGIPECLHCAWGVCMELGQALLWTRASPTWCGGSHGDLPHSSGTQVSPDTALCRAQGTGAGQRK